MTEEVQDVSEERKAFHEQRATVLGATDSPKILGLSRWGTALSVYNDKTSPDLSNRQMSLPAWLGLKMESAVAELYTARTGNRVRADNRMHTMPGYDFIGCHLDYRVWSRPDWLVEAKTRAYMKGWGGEDENKIPVDVWVQVQHEMMVTGADRCDVAVLFGHHTFRVYEMISHESFQRTLLERLIRFREDNWLAGVPPPATGHPVDTDIVKGENQLHGDLIKPVTPEQAEVVDLYRRARFNVKQAAEREAELQNKLIQIIGTAAGISGPFGTITRKKTQDGVVTDWEQVAAAYRKPLDHALATDPDALGLGLDPWNTIRAIESLYTRVKPGYRRFNYQFAEETEDA